jgi:hypothetical protein
MKESFIQFYYQKDYTMFLSNSYSSIWKHIKDRGNIIWIDPTKDYFPDLDGVIYLSCTFENEVDYSIKWIKSRPDIKFIIGGPVVLYMGFNLSNKNVISENKQLYEVLNVSPDENSWGLEYDFDIPEGVWIYYNYSLSFGNKCYWGKCNFCRAEDSISMDLDIENIPVILPYRNIVWLNKQALSPKNIKSLFPNFDEKSTYTFYLRPDKSILRTIEKINLKKIYRPIIGVEFPSDRMLNLMNKGTDINTIKNIFSLFLKSGNHVIMTVIHAWSNLIDDDVKKVEDFLLFLEPFKKQINCINHWLFLHDNNPGLIPCKNKYNKFYYIYNLDEKQKDLNNKVLNLYKNFGFNFYTENFKTKLSGVINE